MSPLPNMQEALGIPNVITRHRSLKGQSEGAERRQPCESYGVAIKLLCDSCLVASRRQTVGSTPTLPDLVSL